MADTTFEDAAEQLYALVPGEFIAARKALSAAAGDGDTAARIRALRKPPTAAWVANLLARRRPDDIDALAALAGEFREAQEARDAAELTRLNKERRTLLAGLVRTATALAEAAGVTIGAGIVDDVSRTLGAAARDEAAAAALRTGRLLRPLEASGVDPVDLADAVAGDAPAPPAAPRGRDDLAERRARREAERAAQAAERELADAARGAARAESRRDAARERSALLQERVAGLEKELGRVHAEAETAAAELTEAERVLRESTARERAAEKAARRAGVPGRD